MIPRTVCRILIVRLSAPAAVGPRVQCTARAEAMS